MGRARPGRWPGVLLAVDDAVEDLVDLFLAHAIGVAHDAGSMPSTTLGVRIIQSDG